MSDVVIIYKAPQRGMAQTLLKKGFQIDDFPYNPPYLDGHCYFAGPCDRSIAEEFNLNYGEGILKISIDKAIYEELFRPLENRYDEEGDGKRTELAVPQRLFPILNRYPRVLKTE